MQKRISLAGETILILVSRIPAQRKDNDKCLGNKREEETKCSVNN